MPIEPETQPLMPSAMPYRELKTEYKRHCGSQGLRTSFKGCTAEFMRSQLSAAMDAEMAPLSTFPPSLLKEAALRGERKRTFESLVGSCTLKQLGRVCLPNRAWKHWKKHGWLRINLDLSPAERELIQLCHRVALCELGVNPRKPDTFENTRHVSGFESSWGWLRSPILASQVYLATHPRCALGHGLFTSDALHARPVCLLTQDLRTRVSPSQGVSALRRTPRAALASEAETG